MWSTVVAPLLLLHLLAPAHGQRATNQQQVVSQCPLPNGFFADAQQCDKYYQCVDNVITEKLCPDGLAFVDHNPRAEKCDYLSVVDCAGRADLQPARPIGACQRQNGYFVHPDSTVCNQFFFCSEGTGNLVTCPTGLVFSLASNNCVWADEAGRTGCAPAGGGPAFECPAVSHDVAVTHPRYADPDDCQYFYVCIDGVNPRRNGCIFGQVFNSAVGACMSPAETPECGGYYTDYFDNYFKTLDTGGRPRGEVIAAAFEAGYDIPPSAFSKISRPATQAVAAPAGAAAPSSAFRQSTQRRRRPVAQAAAAPAPLAPAPAPVPAPVAVPVATQSIGDTFSLSTGVGAAGAAPAPAPVTPIRRRRPIVRARRPVNK